MKFLVDILEQIAGHFLGFFTIILALCFSLFWIVWDKFCTFVEICEGSKKIIVVNNPNYRYPIK